MKIHYYASKLVNDWHPPYNLNYDLNLVELKI